MNRWKQLGGQAGIGVAAVGFILIFLGWNGAATYNFTPAQFPYLISGGLAGLALVVIASALLIINAQRQDRALLLNSLAELREAVERASLSAAGPGGGSSAALLAAAEESGLVVAGPSSYHRPTCRLLEGRGVLPTITVQQAEERNLAPCRACDAATFSLPVSEAGSSRSGRRSRTTG